MANINIVRVDQADPRRPIVHLSALPSVQWKAAFDAYVRWAKGGPIPPDPPAETHFSDVVIQSDFVVQADTIRITLRPPNATYEHVRGFVEEAGAYANQHPP